MDLDLAGAWTLTEADGADAIPATVPGDAHSALIAAGRIPDPYLGRNEDAVQWVGERTWTFAREFTADTALLAAPSVELVCESLDTFAEISVNGRFAGRADNQHRRWRFEVRPLLQPGVNRIAVRFAPAQGVAVAQVAKLPYPVPWCTSNQRLPHINLIRKAQCHAGWDWGPCLMMCGIADGIRLEAVAVAAIDYVTTVQRWNDDGSVAVEVAVEARALAAGSARLEVELDGQRASVDVTLAAGANRPVATVTVARPRLWWPNGHGAQPLYDLRVALGGREVRKRLGLRRLELVNRDDERGTSMAFRVNGRDIFAKGADWIPADAITGRQTRAVFADLLDSAQAANMNMLRVWGGGQFERDEFYDLCDERGLLVWHDMMFACALYPATADFLGSVREEALHQVKRLRDHACIALWCGDNECVGVWNWYPESKQDPLRYVVGWDRLNSTLRNAIAEGDPTRTFWPSSPCAGPGDFSDCWRDDRRGDMHYWEVWHGGKPFDAYYAVSPRFCSEFGFQSFPSLETVQRYAPDPAEWNVTAPVMEHHQRSGDGNRKIVEMFTRYFRMPEGFAATLWLSQLQQALAIKLAVEYWRTLTPSCMGTLFWQLNDNWPVASWSSIEHGGKWKQLQYQARRFFAPVIATVVQRDGQVELWAVNDLGEPLAATAVVEVLAVDGSPIERIELDAGVAPVSSRRLAAWPLARLAGADPTQRFMRVALSGRSGERAIAHENEHLFAPPKRYELPAAAVRATVAAGPQGLAVTLATDRPAWWVHLDAPGVRGVFGDSSFLLLPGRERVVAFAPKEDGVTAERLAACLQVSHLRQTYQAAERPALRAAASR